MIDALLREDTLSEYHAIALGTLLQNAYSGIERILRFLIQEEGFSLAKSGDWHKGLLTAAHKAGLVTEDEYPVFAELLAFRHLHIHGYAFKLKAPRLRQLAVPVPELCRGFLRDIESRQRR